MIRRVPVLLSFDVEPDEIEVGVDAPPWLGFERLLERVKPLRDDLAVATGRPVRFDWFLRMDPQIAEAYGSAAWVVDRFGADLARLRSEGDLVGLHPHALRPSGTAGPVAGRPWRPRLGRSLPGGVIRDLRVCLRRAVPGSAVRRPLHVGAIAAVRRRARGAVRPDRRTGCRSGRLAPPRAGRDRRIARDAPGPA